MCLCVCVWYAYWLVFCSPHRAVLISGGALKYWPVLQLLARWSILHYILALQNSAVLLKGRVVVAVLCYTLKTTRHKMHNPVRCPLCNRAFKWCNTTKDIHLTHHLIFFFCFFFILPRDSASSCFAVSFLSSLPPILPYLWLKIFRNTKYLAL